MVGCGAAATSGSGSRRRGCRSSRGRVWCWGFTCPCYSCRGSCLVSGRRSQCHTKDGTFACGLACGGVGHRKLKKLEGGLDETSSFDGALRVAAPLALFDPPNRSPLVRSSHSTSFKHSDTLCSIMKPSAWPMRPAQPVPQPAPVAPAAVPAPVAKPAPAASLQASTAGGSTGLTFGPSGTDTDGFGLLGLATLVRAAAGGGADRDLPLLAAGLDLHSLGLSLGSSDPLLGVFAHPWGDAPVPREPVFASPPAYRMAQPALKTGHLARFQSVTLLYIFFAMPRDVLQAYSAQELYARGWRYRPEGRIWFRRLEAPASDVDPVPPAGLAAGAPGVEWAFWDVTGWCFRPYTGPLTSAQLVASFLPEEEAQVKLGGGTAAPAPATA